MHRDMRQHVVQEADAGGNLMPAGAVQVERQLDIRFVRLPVELSSAHGLYLSQGVEQGIGVIGLADRDA